jgi:hypothetical protein
MFLKFYQDQKFEICIAVTVKYVLLWVVISCSLVGFYKLSKEPDAFLLVFAALKTLAEYSCETTNFYHTARKHIHEENIVLTS